MSADIKVVLKLLEHYPGITFSFWVNTKAICKHDNTQDSKCNCAISVHILESCEVAKKQKAKEQYIHVCPAY